MSAKEEIHWTRTAVPAPDLDRLTEAENIWSTSAVLLLLTKCSRLPRPTLT